VPFKPTQWCVPATPPAPATLGIATSFGLVSVPAGSNEVYDIYAAGVTGYVANPTGTPLICPQAAEPSTPSLQNGTTDTIGLSAD